MWAELHARLGNVGKPLNHPEERDEDPGWTGDVDAPEEDEVEDAHSRR